MNYRFINLYEKFIQFGFLWKSLIWLVKYSPTGNQNLRGDKNTLTKLIDKSTAVQKGKTIASKFQKDCLQLLYNPSGQPQRLVISANQFILRVACCMLIQNREQKITKGQNQECN